MVRHGNKIGRRGGTRLETGAGTGRTGQGHMPLEVCNLPAQRARPAVKSVLAC